MSRFSLLLSEHLNKLRKMSARRSPPQGGRLIRAPSMALDALGGIDEGMDSAAGTPVGRSRRNAKRPAVSPLMVRELELGPPPLNDTDLESIKKDLASHDYNFAAINAVSKESANRKKELEQIIGAYRSALDRVMMAYVKIKAERETALQLWRTMKDDISGTDSIIKDMVAVQDNLAAKMDEVTGEMRVAVQKMVETTPLARGEGMLEQRRSYAGVLASAADISPGQNSLRPSDGGVSSAIPSAATDRQTIIVSPENDADERFGDASSTLDIVLKTVKPTELGIKVDRLVKSRNKSVRITACPSTLDKIKPMLSDTGMKVKQLEKLNPRLMIRDIPADIERTQFIECLMKQNCEECAADEIRLIYWFPVKDQRSAGAIIEVSPRVRTKFLNQGRVYISWTTCRVTDHLRVTQCFRCLQFGHVAKACNSDKDICGHCSGSHETRSCTGRSETPRCHNCGLTGVANVSHAALDATKCPILKRRLLDKSKTVNY